MPVPMQAHSESDPNTKALASQIACFHAAPAASAAAIAAERVHPVPCGAQGGVSIRGELRT